MSRRISFLVFVASAVLIPRATPAAALAALPNLASFKALVANGDPDTLRGVYAEGLFALPIVQQPPGETAYVSHLDGTATQFNMPARGGVMAVLAHAYLSGQRFFELEVGQRVHLVYGDGRTVAYRVTEIQTYQATEPTSVTSRFIDLDSHQQLTARELYARVYRGPEHLTFQTCIERPGSSSWGRLFVIAIPDTSADQKTRGR